MTDTNLQVEEPAEAATPEVEKVEPATTPESEGAEDQPEVEEKSEDKPKKPGGGFQRRIDELTRNWREAERRNDELLTILKGNKAPEAPQEQAPPTLEQFGYDEGKYQQALTGYVSKIAREQARAEFQEERQHTQQEARTQTFKQRESEFAASVEDYADKVYDPTLPLSATVVEMIAESDIGPKVAYHLAENPDIARSMYAMTPTQAAREFGKLEAKLSSPVSRKAVSSAPPPPPKIASADSNTLPSSADDPESDNLSTDQWLKLRNKQLRKKG